MLHYGLSKCTKNISIYLFNMCHLLHLNTNILTMFEGSGWLANTESGNIYVLGGQESPKMIHKHKREQER